MNNPNDMNNPKRINLNSRPSGISRIGRKGLGVVFGLSTLFLMTLAYGVIYQQKNVTSAIDNNNIQSALDNDLSDKLAMVPNELLEPDKPQTIINNTPILPKPDKPITQNIMPKPNGLSMKDILMQHKFAALEGAVTSETSAYSGKNGSSASGGRSVRDIDNQINSNRGINTAQLAGLINDSGDDPNQQVRKENFLQGGATQDYPNEYLNSTRRLALTPYEVKQGTVIPAIMVGGLNSDLPGYIKAMVSEDVYDTARGDFLLIPKGSQLVGVYDSRVVFGQTRVLVVWRRLVFPDASTLELESMPGMDESGFSGLNDKVNNHYLKVFGAGLILSLFQAGYDISTDNNNNNNRHNSNSDTAAEAVSKQFSQIGIEYAKRGLQIQPTIEIRNGKQFNVFVHKDILFNESYSDRSIDVAEYESKLY